MDSKTLTGEAGSYKKQAKKKSHVKGIVNLLLHLLMMNVGNQTVDGPH